MSNLPALTTPVYCTDEDVLVKASGDYVTLAPSWQCMARGADGVFASGMPWVLSSASVNFGTNGVQPNQVVALSGANSTPAKTQFPGGGDLLAIDSVSGNAITLRRPYKDLNIGMPPGPAAGLTGVTFSILTFDPQTASASFDIKRRFGIDENITFRDSSWIYDLQDLRMLTVLTVLYDRYTAELRSDRGDWQRKLGHIRNLRDEVADRVQVRWGPYGNSSEATTIFSCKISR
jgi:hypothetical protein